jgi:hypothetical protein
VGTPAKRYANTSREESFLGTAIDPTNAAATPARQRSSQVLDELRAFVHRERDAAQAQLMETWSQPLADKLAKGLSQRLLRLEAGPDAGTVWAYPDRGDSRFREGDLLCLHLDLPSRSAGSPRRPGWTLRWIPPNLSAPPPRSPVPPAA